MIKKACPACKSQVAVACKSCKCGHSFSMHEHERIPKRSKLMGQRGERGASGGRNPNSMIRPNLRINGNGIRGKIVQSIQLRQMESPQGQGHVSEVPEGGQRKFRRRQEAAKLQSYQRRSRKSHRSFWRK
uniref:UPF0547 domain-containing protein n=1 Tax=Lutzomyia longipalpis TaxID=7200 RepID=A0A1B0CPA2_LUTLO